MIKLNQLITSLSTEEQTDFEAFLKKKNRRSDTKNILLFRLLASGETNSNSICVSLYNKDNKNAYHALRKRLYDSLLDFVATINLVQENDTEMLLIKNIVSARSFFQRKQYEIAFHILKKAENIAHDHLLFPILNEIYHTQIQYAYTSPNLDLNSIIKKFNKNQQYYLAEERLNIVYAIIREQVNASSFQKKPIDFNAVITTTLNKHNIDINQSITFKSLYQLISIASISAFASKDYYSIESFLINTYEKIKNHQQKQQYYHIQVLYLIANMYFRNKKFKLAFAYLQRMMKEMEEKNSNHLNTFLLKHQNLLALCYNYSNQNQKAIEITKKHVVKKHPDLETQLDIILCLCMYYFHNKNYQEALKTINSFYHSDKWYQQKSGNEWVIKKNLIELLIHIELDHLNLVESRILSFKRKHTVYLKSIEQKRVLTFISLIEELYLKLNNKTTPGFLNKIESSFNFISNKQEDIFVMSFYAWLKAKATNKDIYKTTIEMIQI